MSRSTSDEGGWDSGKPGALGGCGPGSLKGGLVEEGPWAGEMSGAFSMSGAGGDKRDGWLKWRQRRETTVPRTSRRMTARKR